MNTAWRITPSVHVGTWNRTHKWCCVRLRSKNCQHERKMTMIRQRPRPRPRDEANAREEIAHSRGSARAPLGRRVR